MFCFVMILRRYLDVENLKFEILVEAPIKKFQQKQNVIAYMF